MAKLVNDCIFHNQVSPQYEWDAGRQNGNHGVLLTRKLTVQSRVRGGATDANQTVGSCF